MKIGIVQHNPTLADFEGNKQRLLFYLREAARAGAEFCVAPSWALCGAHGGNLFSRQSFIEGNQQVLTEFIATHAQEKLPPVLLGAMHTSVMADNTGIQHCAVLVEKGSYCVVARENIASFAMASLEEPSFPGYACGSIRVGGKLCAVVFGQDIFSTHPTATPPEQDAAELVKRACGGLSVQGVCVLGAQPFEHGCMQHNTNRLAAMAKTLEAPVFFANLTGGADSQIFYGASLACDEHGEPLAQAPAFTEKILIVETEEKVFTNKTFSAPNDNEALWHCLVLGVRDYMHKCGFADAVLGLSGGIDSALVAAIAAEALGPEHVVGLMMPSPHSSQGSIDDSVALAHNLGIKCHILPIEQAVQAMQNSFHGAFGEHMTGLAAENLQPRARGTLLMGYANAYRALVLVPSNKSEIAVGYSTLYGDMCGALAVIGDVYKTQVYSLCRWLNTHKEREYIPKAILEKEPSAELREGQKDTDSLPPYERLDAMLHGLIEEKCSQHQVTEKGFSADEVAKVRRLMDISEFKRMQAAPSLYVSSRPFGPQTQLPLTRKL